MFAHLGEAKSRLLPRRLPGAGIAGRTELAPGGAEDIVRWPADVAKGEIVVWPADSDSRLEVTVILHAVD